MNPPLLALPVSSAFTPPILKVATWNMLLEKHYQKYCRTPQRMDPVARAQQIAAVSGQYFADCDIVMLQECWLGLQKGQRWNSSVMSGPSPQATSVNWGGSSSHTLVTADPQRQETSCIAFRNSTLSMIGHPIVKRFRTGHGKTIMLVPLEYRQGVENRLSTPAHHTLNNRDNAPNTGTPNHLNQQHNIRVNAVCLHAPYGSSEIEQTVTMDEIRSFLSNAPPAHVYYVGGDFNMNDCNPLLPRYFTPEAWVDGVTLKHHPQHRTPRDTTSSGKGIPKYASAAGNKRDRQPHSGEDRSPLSEPEEQRPNETRHEQARSKNHSEKASMFPPGCSLPNVRLAGPTSVVTNASAEGIYEKIDYVWTYPRMMVKQLQDCAIIPTDCRHLLKHVFNGNARQQPNVPPLPKVQGDACSDNDHKTVQQPIDDVFFEFPSDHSLAITEWAVGPQPEISSL